MAFQGVPEGFRIPGDLRNVSRGSQGHLRWPQEVSGGSIDLRGDSGGLCGFSGCLKGTSKGLRGFHGFHGLTGDLGDLKGLSESLKNPDIRSVLGGSQMTFTSFQ